MRTRSLAIGAAALVVVVAVAAVFGLGLGPGADSEDKIESFPTETTPTATQSTTTGTGTATGTPAESTPAPPSFAFAVDRIEPCGETCRDVTTTLTNEGGSKATGVAVYTRIYAGNGTDGRLVWEGTEQVGTLGAGKSYTATKRVTLSVSEALAVQQADGWITVRTAIESDEKTVTFTQRRDVQ
ncbi:MAG: hypothetical protein ABEI80_10140 [Haloplanus sp.]